MAGRGWNGWGWGLGKDTFGMYNPQSVIYAAQTRSGFAVFFFLFEISRRAGTAAKFYSSDLLSRASMYTPSSRIQQQGPAILYGMTLVTGGVSGYIC